MDAGAPIKNQGYYDVPIYNEYSNKDIRDSAKKTNNYLLNRQINLTLNNNKENYIVYQDPVIPSPSLFLETDAPMSGYYYKIQCLKHLTEPFLYQIKKILKYTII